MAWSRVACVLGLLAANVVAGDTGPGPAPTECRTTAVPAQAPRTGPEPGRDDRESVDLPAGQLAPAITDIERFLERCPTDDPASAEILWDFIIRKDGDPVRLFRCTPPISQLPIADYTDALIVLQGLRVIYHMDRGRAGHLPWTPLTMYEWMRERIAGIDIRSDSGSAWCCESFPDGLYIVIPAADDFNRDFDRTWRGISGNIGLYGHEVRHTQGFFHASCCGIPGGCDQTYDEDALSAYGIEYWLDRAWLTGAISVGFSCADPATVLEIASWHRVATEIYQDRFCDALPPDVPDVPEPGGPCELDGLCGNAVGEDGDLDRADDACDNCPRVLNEDQADFDADGLGDACELGVLLADADHSGRVDGFDLVRLARSFGTCDGAAGYDRAVDLDRDGCVDGDDLAILAAVFGRPAA